MLGRLDDLLVPRFGIVAKTGIPRTSLYRHLPPRAAPTVTADSRAAETEAKAMRVGAADAG